MLVLANHETTRNLPQFPSAGKGPGFSSDEQMISKRSGSLLFDEGGIIKETIVMKLKSVKYFKFSPFQPELAMKETNVIMI